MESHSNPSNPPKPTPNTDSFNVNFTLPQLLPGGAFDETTMISLFSQFIHSITASKKAPQEQVAGQTDNTTAASTTISVNVNDNDNERVDMDASTEAEPQDCNGNSEEERSSTQEGSSCSTLYDSEINFKHQSLIEKYNTQRRREERRYIRARVPAKDVHNMSVSTLAEDNDTVEQTANDSENNKRCNGLDQLYCKDGDNGEADNNDGDESRFCRPNLRKRTRKVIYNDDADYDESVYDAPPKRANRDGEDVEIHLNTINNTLQSIVSGEEASTPDASITDGTWRAVGLRAEERRTDLIPNHFDQEKQDRQNNVSWGELPELNAPSDDCHREHEGDQEANHEGQEEEHFSSVPVRPMRPQRARRGTTRRGASTRSNYGSNSRWRRIVADENTTSYVVISDDDTEGASDLTQTHNGTQPFDRSCNTDEPDHGPNDHINQPYNTETLIGDMVPSQDEQRDPFPDSTEDNIANYSDEEDLPEVPFPMRKDSKSHYNPPASPVSQCDDDDDRINPDETHRYHHGSVEEEEDVVEEDGEILEYEDETMSEQNERDMERGDSDPEDETPEEVRRRRVIFRNVIRRDREEEENPNGNDDPPNFLYDGSSTDHMHYDDADDYDCYVVEDEYEEEEAEDKEMTGDRLGKRRNYGDRAGDDGDDDDEESDREEEYQDEYEEEEPRDGYRGTFIDTHVH